MVYTSSYPILHVTVDTVVLAGERDDFHVLVVRRGGEPYRGELALPGGFVEIDEDLPDAAVRELAEETGIKLTADTLVELGAYGRPGRDPRQRTITIAYLAHVLEQSEAVGGDDADEALWLPVAEANGLAFDHDQILADALRHV